MVLTEYLAAGEVEITATDPHVRTDLLPAQAPADRSVAQWWHVICPSPRACSTSS